MTSDRIKFKVLCMNNDLKGIYLKNEEKRNKNDAGFDLFMPKDIVIPAKAISFKLGTKVKASAYKNKMLNSYEIWPRSSMGAKTPLRLCNSIGLVDREYTGELFLCVDNMSDQDWTIKKNDEHKYEGTASDVVGTAKGYSYGPAFKFEYVLLVPIKGKNIKITFDDWIFMQDERVAINRATMTKFGFKVAELTVMFIKD